MKKIFWLLILIFTLYIILIFKAPSLADEIEKLIKINGFNEKVRELKTKLDNLGTKTPDKNQLIQYYSGTIENIKKTKETIDSLRKKAENLKETYNQTKEVINDTQEKLGEIKETIDKVSEVGETINDIITNTGTVN